MMERSLIVIDQSVSRLHFYFPCQVGDLSKHYLIVFWGFLETSNNDDTPGIWRTVEFI